jgi:hypothetical protein
MMNLKDVIGRLLALFKVLFQKMHVETEEYPMQGRSYCGAWGFRRMFFLFSVN